MEDIQELLGHSGVRMTLRYAKISPEKKKRTVMVLEEPRDSRQEDTSEDDSDPKQIHRVVKTS